MQRILILAVILIIFSLTSCKTNQHETSDNPPGSSLEHKREWLKDYALCCCLLYASKRDTLISNDISFSIYREISNYGDDDVYKTIDSVSKKAASKIEPTQIADYNGKKPLLKGCIEYYNSMELDSLVKSFDDIAVKTQE